MKTIIDFHIHSRFSRATSRDLNLEEIAKWSKIKGIDVIATGDFTHPQWFYEIKKHLQEDGSGFLKFKGRDDIQFILSTELSCIYNHKGQTRRLHHVILAPSIAAVEKINTALMYCGAKLASDGRPIIGMSSKELLQLLLEADERTVLIPAHVWTPWFALFGSKSGYDSVNECFEDLTPHIFALETGLSSDPAMNWTLSKLDQYALVSNSDAHSGPKLGREANVFNVEERTYDAIIDTLKKRDARRFLFTIEFFPEEGMYHYDGHRSCTVSFHPDETKKLRGICPQCKKPMTIGVLNRVDNLRDREFGETHSNAIPYKKIIPLPEIIADYVGAQSADSKQVQELFFSIIQKAQTEFRVLLDMEYKELVTVMPEDLASGIIRMREGHVTITPGFDGTYGKISVFDKKNRNTEKQTKLF